jgi:succinate dehydrogenase flavin-adding protein (antitoxin of CptAB toxin-antitoxin module)
MKELDLLMTNYLEHSYPDASAQDRQAFESILQLPDPELYDLILGRNVSSDQDIARVIAILRDSLT